MAGGDGSTCAPKAIRRCLWETDGSNGDNEDKTIYTEDILSRYRDSLTDKTVISDILLFVHNGRLVRMAFQFSICQN